MTNGNSPLKRVFITGALVGTLSLASVAALTAQEATAAPDAPAAETAAQSEPGFLGVRLAESDDGALVTAVVAGSPAEAAGILEEDVITAVNDEAAATAADVAAAIGALHAGDSVTLTVSRAGDSLDVTVTLAARPVEREVEESSSGSGNGTRFFNIRGRQSLAYNSADQTWTVGELSEDSPLYADGLRAGDVVTAIDGSQYEPMTLMGHLAELGADASLTLTVTRDGATVEVTAPVLDFVVSAMMGHGVMGGRMDMMPLGQMGQGAQNMPFSFGQRSQNLNGYLGVRFVTLDATVAADRGASLTDGALVVEVVAGSPAETAGLLVDDIITAVNGEPVDAERTLRDRLIAYEPEDVLALTVVRDGAEQQVEVTLGEPVIETGRGATNSRRPGRNNSGSRSPRSGSNNTAPGAEVTPEPTPATTGSNA